MGWLALAAFASLSGYAWYAGTPDAFTPWSRFFPFVLGLCLAYLVALRGAYGTWAFPFLGFRHVVAKRAHEGRILALVWIGAVVFRAVLVPATPALSDDVYRYIWDGRVLLAGINPYRYSPQATELVSLRDALWTQINHPELPTIYPPLLMLFFAAVAWVSPTLLMWKVVIVGVDLLAGYAFMQALKVWGKPPAWVLLYLWHPLVLLEFAGNGHADALGILFLALALWALALRKPWASGHSLVLAGLVKFLPWVAVPSLLPRLRLRWLTLPLLAAALYLFFWQRGLNPLGSLDVYAKTWRANDFLFAVFVPRNASETELWHARLIAAACVLLVWLAMILRRRSWLSTYAWTVGVLFCLSPVVHPWYMIWLLPVLFVLPHPAWWVWSLTVMIGYWPLATYRATGVWEESLTWKAWEVSPVLALLPVQAWLERRGNGSVRDA